VVSNYTFYKLREGGCTSMSQTWLTAVTGIMQFCTTWKSFWVYQQSY